MFLKRGKKIVSSTQKKSSIKLAILAISLLILIILTGKIFQLISSISSPLSGSLYTLKNYNWDGKSAINLAVLKDNIYLLNFDPRKEKAVILNVPGNTFIDVPKSFGFWQLESIYQLGQAENKPIGGLLLKLSLSKLLGIPIDGIIFFRDSKRGLSEEIASFSSNPISSILFLQSIESDLSPIELYNFYLGLSNVRSDKLTNLDLGQTNITYSKLLPDASRVLGIDIINLDKFVRDNMADSKILDEGISISVFNATSHPGIGGEAARMITNIGGDVIFIGNSDVFLTKSQVYFKSESVTATKLAKIFAPECLKAPCQPSDPKISASRANINVVLGEDFYKLWYQK